MADTLSLRSPDKSIELSFACDASNLTWSVKKGGKQIIDASNLGLRFADLKPLGLAKVTDRKTRSVDTVWKTMLYRKEEVRDRFNELAATVEGEGMRLGLVFRCYNEGVAFRYVVPEQSGFDGFQLLEDQTEWRFPGDPEGWITTYPGHHTSQEEEFKKMALSAVPKDRLVGMPAVLEVNGCSVALTEACLVNWAGMFFRKTESGALKAELTPLPKSGAATPNVAVIRTTPAESPWRVMLIGKNALDLVAKKDLIVNLNPPPEAGMDFSWVKPGPTSWDWWTESNNSLSTEQTLKFIDFASEMGWPYHTIDGGWYGFARRPSHGPNVELKPRKNFDLKRIVEHGREKNVGIWVWIHWREVNDIGIDETFARLEQWGVKGLKTDFMDRQDQWMVNWYERVCRAAARHRIMVNFHGAMKPTGTERTWPNNLTREGVRGNEMNKFSLVTSEHCATLPFTRFLLGPADFTPGSFGNVFAKDFTPQCRRGHRYGDESDHRQIWAEEPGTRAQALAKCVCFDSPLTTLCDWPERYRGQAGVEALKNLPTTWKRTIPIAGKIGEYYAVLRENHDGRFYFAAFSVKRKLVDLKLDFLGDGEWKMRVFADDHELTPGDAKAMEVAERKVKKDQLVGFSMIPEGGALAIFEKIN